jgi:hypothetical protein
MKLSLNAGGSYPWIKAAVLSGLALAAISGLARFAAFQPISDQTQGLVIARGLVPVAGVMLACTVGIIIALLVGEYSPRVNARVRRYAVWLLSVTAFGSAFVFGVALIPKERNALQNSLTVPPSVIFRAPSIIVNHPIYFDNGSHQIARDDRTTVSRFMAAIASCEAVDVEAVGFASSAPYRNDQEGARNLALALAREESVVALAHANHIANAHPHNWVDVADMTAHRGVKDTLNHGERAIPREFLNRRVDIVVKLPPECMEEQKAVAAPPS